MVSSFLWPDTFLASTILMLDVLGGFGVPSPPSLSACCTDRQLCCDEIKSGCLSRVASRLPPHQPRTPTEGAHAICAGARRAATKLERVSAAHHVCCRCLSAARQQRNARSTAQASSCPSHRRCFQHRIRPRIQINRGDLRTTNQASTQTKPMVKMATRPKDSYMARALHTTWAASVRGRSAASQAMATNSTKVAK